VHYNDEPCLRDVIDDSDWCIFHHPKNNLEFHKVFKEAFDAEVARQKHIHPEYFDFTGFVFPIEMEFGDMTFPVVYFKKAEFIKDVKFTPDRFKYFGQGGTQSGCQFQGKADFSDTKFSGTTDFLNARFYQDCTFYGVEFVYDVHFSGAFFEGQANFASTKYNYVTFDYSEFNSRADFSRSKFRGEETSFNGVKFNNDVTFRGSDFWGTAYFNWIQFDGAVDFTDCKFVTSGFTYTIFKGITTLKNIYVNGNLYLHENDIHSRFFLNVKEWRKPEFLPSRDDFVYTSLIQIRNPIFQNNGKMIISGSMGEISKNLFVGLSLQYCDLDNISLIDVEWPRISKNGRKASVDELIVPLGRQNFSADLKTGTPDSVAQLYRSLRDKYEKERRYHEAGDFFRAEMDVRKKFAESRTDKALLTFYNELSRYGESIGLPILWAILFILSSSLMITITQHQPQTAEEFLKTLIVSVLPTVLMAFYPLGSVNEFHLFIVKLFGSLLIGTIFIAAKRKLERK